MILLKRDGERRRVATEQEAGRLEDQGFTRVSGEAERAIVANGDTQEALAAIVAEMAVLKEELTISLGQCKAATEAALKAATACATPPPEAVADAPDTQPPAGPQPEPAKAETKAPAKKPAPKDTATK